MNFWDQAEIPRFRITSHVATYVEEIGLCRTPRSNEDQRPYPSYKMGIMDLPVKYHPIM